MQRNPIAFKDSDSESDFDSDESSSDKTEYDSEDTDYESDGDDSNIPKFTFVKPKGYVPRPFPSANRTAEVSPVTSADRASVSAVKAPAPTVRASVPAVKVAVSAVRDSAPVVRASAPVVRASAPVVKASAPVVKASSIKPSSSTNVPVAKAPIKLKLIKTNITAPVLKPLPTGIKDKQELEKMILDLKSSVMTYVRDEVENMESIDKLLYHAPDESDETYEARRRLTNLLGNIKDFPLRPETAVVTGHLLMNKAILGVVYTPEVELCLSYLRSLIE